MAAGDILRSAEQRYHNFYIWTNTFYNVDKYKHNLQLENEGYIMCSAEQRYHTVLALHHLFVFVQIANCICPNCKIYCAQQRKDIIQLALQRLFPEPLNQLFPLTGEKINVIILKKFPPIVRE